MRLRPSVKRWSFRRIRRRGFRLRSLMIVIALIALPLGVWRNIESRRIAFERASRYHFSQLVGMTRVDDNRHGVLNWTRDMKGNLKPMGPTAWARDIWHRALWEKYDLAAKRPWMPVASDPPPPKAAPAMLEEAFRKTLDDWEKRRQAGDRSCPFVFPPYEESR